MDRRKDGMPRSLPGSDLLFLAPPPPRSDTLIMPDTPPGMVWRQRKFQPAELVPRGDIIEDIGGPMTGKTTRAGAWEAEDPENRRVVDGDRKEANRLADQGYDVYLTLLPGM